MQHVLIVGGTGMLRGVTSQFIGQGDRVTLLARTASELEKIKSEAKEPSLIQLLPVDYKNSAKAVNMVAKSIEKHGPIAIAILWIHQVGLEFKNMLMDLLHLDSNTTTYLVLGSSGINQTAIRSLKATVPNRDCTIVLGSVEVSNTRRWLTHQEICEGTLYAIEHDIKFHIIGSIPDDHPL